MSHTNPENKISREESRAVYQQGEEALITLVEGLLERIRQLELRVEVLENQRQKDRHNSSKPPTTDGFGKRSKSHRPKSEHNSGGQKDHPGRTLEWREEVDEVVVHPVNECEECGASLADSPVCHWHLRQVHDLAPLQLVVSEHQAEEKCCPGCGMLNQAAFPPDVNSVVQYGSSLKGLMVYLMEGQLLPTKRVCELLHQMLECQVSDGTLYNARQRCYEQLEAVETLFKAAIQAAEVGHFDETGMRVQGKLMWLHVACTAGLTYYFMHPKRGQDAMKAMNLLPRFSGTSSNSKFKNLGSVSFRIEC